MSNRPSFFYLFCRAFFRNVSLVAQLILLSFGAYADHPTGNQTPLVIYIHSGLVAKAREVIESISPYPVTVRVFSGVELMGAMHRELTNPRADVVIGLEGEQIENLVEQAQPLDSALFKKLSLPFKWTHPNFLPISYSYLVLLDNAKDTQARYATRQDMCASISKKSLVMPDPRTSMVGRGGLLWLGHIPQCLGEKVLTYPKGWSGAFELFKRGHVRYMLGYNLSVLYEGETTWHAHLLTQEAHPIQTMVAFVTVKGGRDLRVKEFLKHLLAPAFQQHIIKAYSYPVIDIPVPNAFDDLRPRHGFLLDSFDQSLLKQWMRSAYKGKR